MTDDILLHRTVILADGDYPRHPLPLAALHGAARIVCCDGAAAALLAAGLNPNAVVGDLDSLPPELAARLADRLVRVPEQETNDLAKAFRYCLSRGWSDLLILGATGRREDHTLGNLSLLADFAAEAPGVLLVTDTGIARAAVSGVPLAARPGQAVSIFALAPGARLRSQGLRYPLDALSPTRWWQATLNEALDATFTLTFEHGPVLVFACHADTAGKRPGGGAVSAPLPVALTIAGSDSGGNAGIQADLRAFMACGVHGCTAITALTAQNARGVRDVLTTLPASLAAQLEAIFEGYGVGAVKTGMLATPELIDVVADQLAARPGIPKVVDPVMVATSGARLLAEPAVARLRARLLPLATLITPNLPEAEVLLGRPLGRAADRAAASRELAERHGCAVLLKGGHDPAGPARDLFCERDGTAWSLETPAIPAPVSTHGTGCTLSAAIAASLAKGQPLRDAVVHGKAFVYAAIREGLSLRGGGAVLGRPDRLPVAAVSLTRLGPPR